MSLDTWGRLELLGHRVEVGHLTEETIAGVAMLRIDTPANDGTISTAYYTAGAIYGIHPMSEEAAREYLAPRKSVRVEGPFAQLVAPPDTYYDEDQDYEELPL